MLGRTLKLILESTGHRSAAGRPAGLAGLFDELAQATPPRPVAELEDDIWDLWLHHDDPDCAGWMVRAIAAMTMQRTDDALMLLSQVIAVAPDWPEAWNKRATLHFMAGQDVEALADIDRTVTLEPRHFGAIAGFGHIALRHGDLTAAQAAFEVALGIHPHLQDIRLLVHEIGRDLPHTVN